MKKTEYDVILIGGGPGGTTCATLLARAGHRVLVLERHSFPRFHIGESVSVYGLDHFKRLGVFEELKSLNFIKKRGIEFCMPGGTRKAFFPPSEAEDDGEKAWTIQMTRDKLDHILMNNARKSGVEVREEQAVKQVLFEGDRAVGVEWMDHSVQPAVKRREYARWIVDASGLAGVLNRQLGDNSFDDFLLQDKIAVFTHIRGDFQFKNSDDELNFRLCIHENERDWAWFIPLEEDLLSLGVVLSRDTVKHRGDRDLREVFYEAAAKTSFLGNFLEQQDYEHVGKFRAVKDYSFRSRRYYGPGWALVGDAAGFIDPLFSTGIQITFNSATKLADTLDAMLRQGDQADDSRLQEYSRAMDRFFRVGSTVTHLFYLSRMNPSNYESFWYMLRNIKWAGLRDRLRFVKHVARLYTVPAEKAIHWGEEVLFGQASEDNLIARMYYDISQNYERYYAKQIQSTTPRQQFIELEV